MSIHPLFAWYDIWIGAYWDRTKRRLYVLPVPCLGIVIDFGKAATVPFCPDCGQEIDPEVCWCGSHMDHHNLGSGHSPVPMGCVCGYADQQEPA